jgi:hypothetical protein
MDVETRHSPGCGRFTTEYFLGMIDGIKIYDLKTDPQQLEVNPYLLESWTTTVQNADGVIKYGLSEYFGLKFQIKHQKVRLQGSIHKYRNAGKHNYDNFTAQDVGKVVRELAERFEIDTAHTELNNVEFGVNVVLPFGVGVVLNNLIHYKGSPFMKVAEDGMSYYQCKKAHFIIKIYNKSLQYNLPDNVLRFEIKVLKMQYLKSKSVPLRYLSDLLNIAIYEPLGNILTETFESILFGDNRLNESRLSRKELEVYLRASNPKTWEVTAGGQKQSRKLNRLESAYVNILDKYREGVNFKSVVAELIRAKSLEMYSFYQVEEFVLSFKNVQFLPTNNPNEKTENIQNLHFSYRVNPVYPTNSDAPTSTPLERTKIKLCSGCGKPLKEGQKTYHNENCRMRKFERNGRSNPRNNERNGFVNQYERVFKKPSLFDLSELIKTTPQQNEWLRKSKFNN